MPAPPPASHCTHNAPHSVVALASTLLTFLLNNRYVMSQPYPTPRDTRSKRRRETESQGSDPAPLSTAPTSESASTTRAIPSLQVAATAAK
ncbi:hypothetical protein BD311DRAFT_616936, partial [Dichomitus squalens]